MFIGDSFISGFRDADYVRATIQNQAEHLKKMNPLLSLLGGSIAARTKVRHASSRFPSYALHLHRN